MIRIACSADQRFIADCAVMLRSLFASNPQEHFNVHFLHDARLPKAELARLRQVIEGAGQHMSALCVTPDLAQYFPFSERFGYNAWYRVLLPQVLPQISRILYLDSDLLILGAVRPMWDIDLDTHALAAVTQPIPDNMIPRVRDTLGLPGREHYFNSGVMLLDLDALRAMGCVERVVEFIRDRRAPMPWADQDPLNAVLHRHRVPLDPRWNVMTPMFDSPSELPPFDPAELRSATRNPQIVHFIGEFKPLHYRCRHPYRRHYFEHLAQTPWRDRQIYGRSLKHMLLRPLPWAWQHRVEGWWRRLRRQIAPAQPSNT